MEFDKENIPVMEEAPATPVRTPFQEVGNKISSSTPMFLKRAQYSQVTPFYSPLVRTPLRQKVQGPCAMRLLNNSADVPLNSLIYKKVIGILEEKQKEHERAVEEKNSVIDRLQHQLQMVQLPTETFISASLSLQGTSQSPGSKSSADCACSPIPTPVLLRSKQGQPESISATGLTTGDHLANSVDSPFNFKLDAEHNDSDSSFSFLPQLDSACSLELTNMRCGYIHKEQLPDDFAPLSDRITFTDTLQAVTSVSVDSTRLGSQSISAETLYSDKGNTSPLSGVNMNTSPLRTAIAGAKVSPTKYDSVNTTRMMAHIQRTPKTSVPSSDVDTMVTPLRLTSVSVGTSPILVHTQGINTIPVCGTDVASSEDSVSRLDVGTNTDPASCVDEGTMAMPVQHHESSQCTSPFRNGSQEICTTPPPHVVSRSAGTSPVNHTIPSFRREALEMFKPVVLTEGEWFTQGPSEIDFSSLGVTDLALQLESAAISNTLLRARVETLQHEKSSVIRKVTVTAAEVQLRDKELKRLEAEADRREKLASMSATTQVDELMEQQAQLLTQISTLRSEIDRRDARIAEKKAEHEQHVASLHVELTNLRKDLVTAYQLRKEEVEKVRADFMAVDYKPHYQRARQLVQLLQVQLSPFKGLTDEIEQAHKLQEEAAALVSRRAAEVESKLGLLTQHFKQHHGWKQQHAEMETRVAMYEERLLKSRAEVEQRREELTEAQREVTQLSEAAVKTEDEEKVQIANVDLLRASITVKEQEVEATSKELQAKTEEVATLTNDLSTLRTTLTIQTERMSQLVRERDRYMTLGQQQRFSLISLRSGACHAKQLEQDLESLRAEHKFLLAEHSIHLSEHETMNERMKSIEEETAQFKSQTESAQDQLEAERAHNLILLQHKEAEEEAAASAFSELVQKISLLETRVGFYRLQCEVEVVAATNNLDESTVAESKNINTRRCLTLSRSLPSHKGMDARKSMEVLSTINPQKSSRKSFVSSVLHAVDGVNSPATPLSTLDDQEALDDAHELSSLGAQIQGLGKTVDRLFDGLGELAKHVQSAMAVRAEVTQLQQITETHTATIERYKNQKIKLNYNWKMAENELKNLEKMLEMIREVLCAHKCDIRATWREANRLQRIGMLTADDTTAP